MKISYATKRDRNGNRHIIIIDSESKTFALTPAHWYCKEDYIEVSASGYRTLRDAVRDAGYTEQYTMQAGIEA